MIRGILFFTIVTAQCLYALVSIAPMEIGESTGVHGNVALAFETKRGNTDKDNYKGSAKVSYDNNVSYVTWGEISAEYGQSNQVEDTNKQYMHLRYIRATSKKDMRYEVFVQMEEDKFKLIKNRTLTGVGLRFKIFEIFKDGRGYIGLGTFYEDISYVGKDPHESNVRLNAYFAYTAKFGEDSRVTYTIYYQPKIDEVSDNVRAQKLQLELHVYKQLFLNFQVAYDTDSEPPIGVEDYDFTQTTSFVYKF